MPTKKKSNAGRPTDMTPDTIKKLEEAFAFGCSDGEACFYADISKQTLYNYQHKHPEFVDRKESLKQRPVLMARQSVVRDLATNSDLALKFLERKVKDEFSTRREYGGTEEETKLKQQSTEIEKMKAEALMRIAIAKEKRNKN